MQPDPHTFASILYEQPTVGGDVPGEPEFFADLNLDRALEAMTAGREEYQLSPFFYAPLHDVAAVRYRHEILRDLEREATRGAVLAFAQEQRRMREQLAQAEKLHYRYQKEAWFLDAVEVYCGAVATLAEELARLELDSRGLRALRDFLAGYTQAEDFAALAAETRKVKGEFAAVRYEIHLKGNRVKVSPYADEADYSAEVEETFARFKQGAVKDYRIGFRGLADMDHVEARILELVARLNPDVFAALDSYCDRHVDYLEPTIVRFDREVQFYLAYLEYVERLESAGLPFCYPHVSVRSKEVSAEDAFDLALATKLASERATPVRNDFFLEGSERILVVTGPNQGGKTTFARMFGQLHYLASLGLPVPARKARLYLPDRLFAHFEEEEDLATLRGKLEDELVRIHEILEQATGDSVVVMNESFTSTTLQDAVLVGTEVLQRIVELGALCVCVTFVDELTSLGEATVSMASTVVPENPAERTYKIVRKPADGLAYAWAIAEKYGLTYERLRERVS